MLAFKSVIFSFAQVIARTNPVLADTIVSYDGRLTAAHAATLITPNVTAQDRFDAAMLSGEALRHAPMAVSAATTLGLTMSGNAMRAQRLFHYAQMLSRRNIQTQLWSIEDAAARGDVPNAMRWYDIALRTNPKMGDVLYPTLTQAMEEPAVRTALVRTLSRRPVWLNSYINYVAGQGKPANSVLLFSELHNDGMVLPDSASAAVIDALIDAGKISSAWNYYAKLRPNADRQRARDPHFAALLQSPSMFDWRPVNDGSIATSIQRARNGGSFEFSAPASVGGIVLRQMQLLSPGTYRLAGHRKEGGQDTHALPYWTLVCRRDGRELGRVEIPNSAQASGAFSGAVTVPTDCPVQMLMLFAPPSDAISGISAEIDFVELTPAGQM